MFAPPQLDRPIFIVGSVRSGTTLLAQCMGEHPEIRWVHDEGLELCNTWHTSSRISLGVPSLSCVDCLPASRLDATSTIRQATKTAFLQLFNERRASGEHRFLNKNPHLWNKLEFLHEMFPYAQLIITGRDVRSTVLSTQFLWMRIERTYGVKHYLPPEDDRCFSCVPAAAAQKLDQARLFPGGDVTVLADYWLRVYEAIDGTIDCFDQARLVRHRDLVSDPDSVLSEVEASIDVSPRRRPLGTELDTTRNDRWPHLLASREREKLEQWTTRHKPRIAALRFADTTVA